MAIKTSLVISNVMHKRLHPRVHAFNYKVYYLCFALSQRHKLKNPFLSLEKGNLLSFYQRDHGPRDGNDLEQWIRTILATHNILEADGDIILLTLPRVLGYVFNPVSFWFCLDHQGNLRAVLSEVGNTFGERHSYISFHDDHRIIQSQDWLTSQKVFHVSPFMDVKGHYLFRFTCTDTNVSAHVNYFDDDVLMLTTSVAGKPISLTTPRILRSFFQYPLMTVKVIALIHWEAARLIFKGIRYRPKPPSPPQEITR